ncbi:hypothetical protein DFH29DRAFT_119441 [Suillus ampliporus]|nr:hypothetical protein DFH29DRAFT_119441 [Suillus ampliporus]
MFLVYVLLQRLQAAKPVALYTCDPWYFLFDKNGVTTHAEDNYRPINAFDDIWALSDADAGTKPRFPASSFKRSLHTLTIHATSPCKDRWYSWGGRSRTNRFVMDVWKTKELAALGHALYGQEGVVDILQQAEKWGPAPRDPLRIIHSQRAEPSVLYSISASAKYLVGKFPEALISMTCLNIRATLSSSVFWMQPSCQGKKTMRESAGGFVPRGIIMDQVVASLVLYSTAAQTCFYTDLAKNSPSCTTVLVCLKPRALEQFVSSTG